MESQNWQASKASGKGKKGQGNGKGNKGKSKTKDKGISSQVCYRFQKGKCDEPNCPRRHVCEICSSPDHGSRGNRQCSQKKGKGGARY